MRVFRAKSPTAMTNRTSASNVSVGQASVVHAASGSRIAAPQTTSQTAAVAPREEWRVTYVLPTSRRWGTLTSVT